jgi:DNA (cytosine-5)-methyltransferase 3A
MGIKVLSLFDGISCGMVALERIGIDVKHYVAYEIDKNAIKVSENNYPQIERHGDVFEGDYTKYKGFDLLIGGSPCTHWSINKKDREITSDGIGFQLFNQYARALEESECRYFLYENNHKIHQDIQDEITKVLGVKPILINSATVSAQQRFRLYWTNIPNVKVPQDKGRYAKDIIEEGCEGLENLINETKFNGKSSDVKIEKPLRIGTIGKGGQGERVYGVNGKIINLTANGGGRGAKTGLYLIDDKVRKLTPLEAERAQTLPDNYTEGISNTQRYKGIGNGWTVDVIAHILSFMELDNAYEIHNEVDLVEDAYIDESNSL